MNFNNIHIDSISHKKQNASNILLRYQGKPLKIETDIVVFQSKVYQDERGKYQVDVRITPELHHFLLMLDARLEKYAAEHGLKYLRLVKKSSHNITLKIPFLKKFAVKIFKEGQAGGVEQVQPGEGANVTLSLSNLWIMNNDIAGALVTVSEIRLAFRVAEQS